MRVLALVAVLLAGCSIRHRSDQLACTNNSDCGPNGRCEDNVCTNPNGGFDAAVDPPDKCPDQCSSCDIPAMVCRIDCADSRINCDQKLTCPSGWNCDIRCSGSNDCRAGVDCLKSASCTVSCSGDTACRNVACGGGPCTVACTGDNSCRSIVCGDSCKCDVGCSDSAGCTEVVCQEGQCETFGGGCSSQFLGCSSPCP
jgi:hypothetical protein